MKPMARSLESIRIRLSSLSLGFQGRGVYRGRVVYGDFCSITSSKHRVCYLEGKRNYIFLVEVQPSRTHRRISAHFLGLFVLDIWMTINDTETE
jgi:hypothetical protein